MPMVFETIQSCKDNLKKLNIPLKIEADSTAETRQESRKPVLHKWTCPSCNQVRSQTPCEHCGQA